MPFILSQRNTKSTEMMDDSSCNPTVLARTYRQFGFINAMISGWHKIYKKYLRQIFCERTKTYTLLDIGFGGGDIPLKLTKWAARDGISLEITGIETDERAVAFARSRSAPSNITFEHGASSLLADRGREFDVVISNHLLHHLDDLTSLLSQSKKLSRKLVLFNDIERSDWGYILFYLLSSPFFHGSFITHDGCTSIRRSYTQSELRNCVPADWKVERLFPYRLLLSHHHDS